MIFRNLVVRNKDFNFFKLDKFRILEILVVRNKDFNFFKLGKLRILEIW